LSTKSSSPGWPEIPVLPRPNSPAARGKHIIEREFHVRRDGTNVSRLSAILKCFTHIDWDLDENTRVIYFTRSIAVILLSVWWTLKLVSVSLITMNDLPFFSSWEYCPAKISGTNDGMHEVCRLCPAEALITTSEWNCLAIDWIVSKHDQFSSNVYFVPSHGMSIAIPNRNGTSVLTSSFTHHAALNLHQMHLNLNQFSTSWVKYSRWMWWQIQSLKIQEMWMV
jgi:hypothetical protein